MHKLWGSPASVNSTLDISMFTQQSSVITNPFAMTMVGCSVSVNGFVGNANISLLGSSQNPNAKGVLGLYLDGQTSGSTSSVAPISMNGQNFSLSKNFPMSLYAIPDDVGGGCLISEGVDQFEILIEGSSTCLSGGNIVKSNVPMTMPTDDVNHWQSPMNLTIKFNPMNVINMTMKCQGTRVISNTALITESDEQSFLDQGSLDFLATIDPVVMTMRGSAPVTNFVYMSMPVCHSKKTNVATLNTRGF